MSVVSVRMTDEEMEILKKATKVYGCGISTLLKRITFEKLEEDFDLKVIQKYEEKREYNTLELMDIKDFWKEVGS